MKKIHFLILTFLSYSLITFGQTTLKNTLKATETGWKVLNGEKYSIQYPDNWELNKSGQMGSSFFIFSRLSSPKDKFRENVNLIVQSLNGQKINLDKYVEISEEQIKSLISNGNLIESKRQNINGHEFQKVIYTGDLGIFKLKVEQYYWVLNGQAYILTLTCEKNQFDNYKLTGEKILNSFRLN